MTLTPLHRALLLSAALLTTAALSACRKGVPPPPTPDEVPRPRTAASVYALPTADVRLGR